ncbi:MAG TPA: PepSY-associated TM helix domain-containing protein [Povalibacter sp.]|uniref:PepSY-associated TM helix domain-containing protein n=1 Tax=Povalibacter sp. TaxID=1962978 RepID=UPI002C5DC78A|nr:PepSY-associated TM helix domain-containing protein [Povalibacter sp.]
MFQSFRLAMSWVHTWFGLVLGFVLMAAFFFGTLSVFDREIDRWAVPATRVAAQPMPSFDTVLRPVLEGMQPEAEDVAALRDELSGPVPTRFDINYWDIRSTRDPVTYLYAGYEVPGAKSPDELAYDMRLLVAATGELLEEEPAFIGTGLFYPLHFNLTLAWADLGAWIIGLAAFSMMAALVSGVVIHRKIFREFFTFRPRKALLRSTLDLHNLSGVVALPFHFFFALTGLLIFAGIYFPIAETQLQPLHELHERHEEAQSAVPKRRAGVPVPLASVDAMVVQAQQRWAARGQSDKVEALILLHVGDANGRVVLSNAGEDRVTSAPGSDIHFRASTGEVMHESPRPSATGQVLEYLAGLHLVHFRHWLLRWLYVLGGLLGCVCIATGFIFFVEKRKAQHARAGSQGSRIVDAVAVFAVTGMLIATVMLLAVNRLVPEGLPGRNGIQGFAFWGAWVMAFIHAALRSGPVARAQINPAWREQCWVLSMLAAAAVALNWLTTGDHLIKTVFTDTYWPVAGMDLSLIATGLLAAIAARHLTRRERERPAVRAHAVPT